MKVLVAGATGLLGGEICEKVVARGHVVRALVRPTSSPDRVRRLQSLGVELALGDLKDPGSLDGACRAEEAVVSTAIAFGSTQPGDSLETVDRSGQMNLVDAARREKVRRFVFTSFSGNVEERFQYRTEKRAVEAHLKQSGLEYAILRPSFFMETWLDPAADINVAGGTAQIYGAGDQKISWISRHDVADFAVLAVELPAARNRVLELGGPDPLSPLEVLRIFEARTGTKFHVTHVSEVELKRQWAEARNPGEEAGAALCLHLAGGDVIPMTDLLREFPVQLTSVEQFARAATKPGEAR
jgi:uncharacterized protein YbjT (DUF2867 family)